MTRLTGRTGRTGRAGAAIRDRVANRGRAQRQRRLSGEHGRSRFCGELVRAVLRTYAEAVGCRGGEGGGGGSGGGGNGARDAVRREALRIAAERTARKGMRLMLLERTASEPGRRRRGA